jgi:hypothetical protein
VVSGQTDMHRSFRNPWTGEGQAVILAQQSAPKVLSMKQWHLSCH